MNFRKTIISALAICLMAVSAADLSAQTRAKSGQRKTATTRTTTKKPAARKSAAAPALTEAAIAGSRYMGVSEPFQPSTDCGLFVTVAFSDTRIKAQLMPKYSASLGYEIEGNKIKGVRSMADTWAMDFSSNNGGKTLKGTIKNLSNGNATNYTLYKVPSEIVPATESGEELTGILAAKQYDAFLTLTADGMTLGWLVKIAFKQGEENTWKIIHDSQLIAMLGGLKGTFTLDGNKMSIVDNDEGTGSGEVYNNGEFGSMQLGKRNMAGNVGDAQIIFFAK